MKTLTKASIIILLVVTISFLDFKDRYFFDSKIFNKEIQTTFFNFESEEDVQKMIEKISAILNINFLEQRFHTVEFIKINF